MVDQKMVGVSRLGGTSRKNNQLSNSISVNYVVKINVRKAFILFRFVWKEKKLSAEWLNT